MEEDRFDVAVLGTGLPEAIIAAALAKKGFSVLQLDRDPFYGSAWAALSLDEALTWAQTRRRPAPASRLATGSDRGGRGGFEDVSYELVGQDDPAGGSTSLPPRLRKRSRQYALPLTPALVPSTSRFVDTLVASGVHNYVHFRLLEGLGVYAPPPDPKHAGAKGKVRKVPASKEDVFKDPTLGLVDKRRLMKFLMWAGAGEWDTEETRSSLAQTPFSTFITSPPHSLSPSLASLVLSLVLAPSSSSPTLACLVRLRQTILSIGKFGNSPFLIGQYGGAGEWVGGFARAAAVKGAVQVVGREVEVEKEEGNEEGKWRVKLSDRHAEGRDDDLEFTVGKIIASSEYLDLFPHLQPSPSSSSTSPRLARALVVLSGSIDLLAAAAAPSEPAEADPDAQPAEEEPTVVPPENVLVVFPSKSLAQEQENPVTALLLGEGAMACPSGERVLCLSAIDSSNFGPERLLKPALSALLSFGSASPLFSLFYSHLPPSLSSPSPSPSTNPSSNSDEEDLLVVPSLTLEDAAVLTASSDKAAQVAEEVVRRVTGDEQVWEKEATEVQVQEDEE